MMDSQQQGGGAPMPPMGGGGGLFGGLGGRGGPGGASQLSPYLNVDPTYLNAQTPEFIFNQVRNFRTAHPRPFFPQGALIYAPVLDGSSPFNGKPYYHACISPPFQDQKRGRMEKSFTAIGSSVLLGGVAGGVFGLYDGVRQTARADLTGRLRRVQVMNYTIKSGGSVSNALGSIAVIYSSIYCLVREQNALVMFVSGRILYIEEFS